VVNQKRNKVWLTWHYSARSRNLASFLELNLNEKFIVGNVLTRHMLSSFWTILILLKKRPAIIFIQLSFLLLLISALYKVFRFGNVVLIADCHTKALRRKAKGVFNIIFWPIKKLSFKFVNLSIISNEEMIPDIISLHPNFVILPDKIPGIKFEQRENEVKYCVYVSSFAVDEPFEEIIKVAEYLNPKIRLYWTGKIPKNKIDDITTPDNLVFTDYLSFKDYYNLLGNSSCVIALTTEKGCLQSGAYEALSLEIPLVISDTSALKNYFQNSAVYTSHDPEDVYKSILIAIEMNNELKDNCKKIKITRNKEFEESIQRIRQLVDD